MMRVPSGVIVLVALCSLRDVSAQERHFDVAALGRLVQIAEPRISPDGRQVAVIVRRPNYEKNVTEAEMLLVDVQTGERRNLTPTRTNVSSPRWSPSGDRLAFLAPGDSATQQVWLLPMSGGEAVMLTRTRRGVRQFAWHPDGNSIAYVTDDDPAVRTGVERHNRSFEVERNDYLATAAPLARHLWVMPAAGGEARRVTSGSWSLSTLTNIGVSWSSDGRSIYVTSQAGPGTGHWYDVKLGLVDVATGQLRPIGPFANALALSPDGQRIAISSPRGKSPEFTSHGIFVLPSEGGTARLASDIDIALWTPTWYDGATLLLCGARGARTEMWLKPLEGRSAPLELNGLHPNCPDTDVSRNGAIATIAFSEQRAGELYWIERPGAPPRRLTEFNAWLSEYALGRTERITWKSDGFEADGVLTYPPSAAAGSRLPLVLYIHGGPMAQSTARFTPLPQLLAARGFLVFEPNYRGSTGLGNAYQSAVIGDAGAGPGRDVMSGLSTLIRRGLVDTTRIGVSGWSYGGYMTTWLMGHYPGVWRAGLAGAAVTDYADSYYLSDYGPAFGAAWGGSPFMAPYDRLVREQSPITYASRIKAPLLILATTGDARVPVIQSYKLFSLLRDHGRPVTFIAYPVPGHFPADPVHARDVWRRWVDWFTERLLNAGGPPPVF